MFQSPEFWVGLSSILLVVVAFKPVGGLLSKVLDARTVKIQNELNEAVRLKEEAQALLASYQRKQKEAAIEAQNIITNAENEAKRLVADAEKNLEENLNKKIQVAMQKIASYEHSVMQSVRLNSIDVAMGTVRSLVQEKLNKEVADTLVTRAIGEMSKKLH